MRAIIENIKDSINIETFIGETVVLKRSGSQLKSCCPLHHEKTPSFFVRPSTQTFHCYGCGKNGDVIQFVMERDGIPFMEALHFLAKNANIELPTRKISEEEQMLSQTSVLKNATKAFQDKLLVNQSYAITYWESRGISKETVSEFGCGFATGSEIDLLMSLETKRSIGIIHSDGKTVFAQRLTIPILDTTGHVIAWGARTMGTSVPKYLNSPTTELYEKSKVLFNFAFARRYIRHKDEVIITEGYPDVMICWQVGIRNVVATCGTSLTEHHIAELKRYCVDSNRLFRVVLAFNNDDAGKKATLRAISMLTAAGFAVKIAEPTEKDILDVFAKGGAEAVQQIFEQLKDGVNRLFQAIVDEINPQTGAEIQEAAKRMCQMIGHLPENVRNYYIKIIAKWSNTDESRIATMFSETALTNNKNSTSSFSNKATHERSLTDDVNIETSRQMRREQMPSKSMNAQIKNYLMHHYEFRRNTVANTIEYRVPRVTKWETLRECDLIGELLDEGFKSVEQSLMTFLGSSQIIDYDPFIGYFEFLPEWDGVDYIGQLANYVVAEDTNWWHTMFRKALVRNCACATGFVNSNKQCLVLLGGSDTGKSMFMRFLVPKSLHQYFNENPNIGSKDDKDARLSIAKNFITHLDDIGNISESELKELKSIFSRESVNERLPYARINTTLPRKTTFWGTSDKDEFLIDERGNVRWVVVQIISIQHDGGGKKGYSQNVNIDKVWAQTYALLKSGFQFTLTKEEIEYSERNNTQNHMKRTMEEELILKYYAPATRAMEKAVFLTATDIALRLEELSKKTTLRNVGIALRKLGYEKVYSGKNIRGYFVLQLIGTV